MRSACLEPKVLRIQGLGLFAVDEQSKGDCDFLKKSGCDRASYTGSCHNQNVFFIARLWVIRGTSDSAVATHRRGAIVSL